MANHTNWLSISAMSGTSGQTTLYLSASRNLERKDKTAEIIAYNPVLNVSAKTYVRLDTYAPYINLSPTIIGVEDTGGTYELNITANCPWVISYPDLVTSYSTSAGTGNATISFTVPGTSADTTLVGNIVVTDESGQVSKIARIEQYGSGVHIGIQPVELYFDATGGTKVFVVTANCVYNVRTYDTDWATVEPNSGYTGQTTFTVTVNHQNTGSTVLEGQIDIAAPGSGGAVVLYQKARETRLVGTYNVSSTTNPTKIIGAPYQFSKAELADGTEIPLATGYTFPITGYQEVYLTLTGDTVGANSLYGCPTLESVFIPSGVTTIGDSAFRGCSSLTSVTIPDTVTGINRTAFMETPISNITLPDGLQTLGFQTFGLCYSLTSIDIPSSVTSIGQACFAPSALETIYFHSPTPPTLGSEALDSGHLREIIVPCVYVDAYLSAWPQYAEYISCQDETTLYFITDTSNVRGEGETRTITLLNRNLNPNRIGLVLPSDFPSQGAYTVSGNVITLTYPPNPSTADTRSWRIGIAATTKDGVNLFGTYAITQNANTIYSIPYTADTSPVEGSGETRTITINTSNLVESSITITIEGDTGITYTYSNGVITVVFPPNFTGDRTITVNINGVARDGRIAAASVTFSQEIIYTGETRVKAVYLVTSDTEPFKVSYSKPYFKAETEDGVDITSAITSQPYGGERAGEWAQPGYGMTMSKGYHTIYFSFLGREVPSFLFTTCEHLVSVDISDFYEIVGDNLFTDSLVQCVTFGTGITQLRREIINYAKPTLIFKGDTAPSLVSDYPSTFEYASSGGTLYYPSGSTGYGNLLLRLNDWTGISNTECECGDITGPGPYYMSATYNVSSTTESTKIAGPGILAGSVTHSIWKIELSDGTDITSAITTAWTEDTGYGRYYRFSDTGVQTIKFYLDKPGEYLPINLFPRCPDLISVVIPDSVVEIPTGAFEYCTALSSVTLGNVSTIKSLAFNGCSALVNINIPASVETLEESAFNSCTSLTGITLPNTLSGMGERCFSSCVSLSSITIPETITTIPRWCFDGCSSLASITALRIDAPQLGNWAFSDVNSTGTIYCQDDEGAVINYTEGWLPSFPSGWTVQTL